jgi:hypothetical protein
MSPTIPNQAKLAAIAVAATVLVFSPATFADTPQQDCENAGGTYVKAGPDSTCTFPGTPVGNSDNTKGGSQDTGPGKTDTSENSEERDCSAEQTVNNPGYNE